MLIKLTVLAAADVATERTVYSGLASKEPALAGRHKGHTGTWLPRASNNRKRVALFARGVLHHGH
eukprot:9479750-Pyramimonas_sp.AAC.1